MYDSNSVDVSLIKKNSNDFSFISTVFDLGVNQDFISLKVNVLSTDITNEYTNIWRTLSAIGQEVGDTFLTSILNFLDNIGNIDLCNVKALESMISFFGIYYSVFSSLLNFPLEIHKLLDILSIPREYFFNNTKITKHLLSTVYTLCSCDNTFTDEASNVATTLTDERNRLLKLKYSDISLSDSLNYDIKNLSNYWHNSTDNGISVESYLYINDEQLNNFISAVYFNFLSNQVVATYNDKYNTPIYSVLSSAILSTYSFKINSGNSNIEEMRTIFNISKSFDVNNAVDAYLYGISASSDFSENEMNIILSEISCRTKPFEKTPLDNATKYKYYREVKFKEYYDFIELQNINYSILLSNTSLYNLDNSYFEISSSINTANDISKNRLLSADDNNTCAVINEKYISNVAATLLEITNAIREIRQILKMQCQKNFMKGTYALLYYVINEYLRNNIVTTILKLNHAKGNKSFTLEFDLTKNKNEILTYTDPTDYFNISCNGDNSSDVNVRYWHHNTNILAIGAVDTTNIFKAPDTIEYNNAAFVENQITTFYHNILKNKFADNALSGYNATLFDFLDAIFGIGADNTKLNSTGNIIVDSDVDDSLKEYKEKLFKFYTGLSTGYTPYYYFTNTTHPSYLIHPYLSGFVENMSYSYPINNLNTTIVEDIISDLKKRISKYLDSCGYLINEWRNPLAANSDYLTKYEKSSHINDKNYIDPVVDYDGLFYPYAILQCIDNVSNVIDAISYNAISCDFDNDKLSVNYYYGLQFNTYNKNKLLNQLSVFNELLFAEATSTIPHCLYRYAIDVYGNAYILLKNCRSTDSELILKDSSGILWIRYHNNPIAFPAYVKNIDLTSVNDNYLALLKNDDSTSNNYIKEAELIGFDFSLTAYKEKYKTYNILDFYMSDDKKHITININRKINGKYVVIPCICNISKEYDISRDYVLFNFEGLMNKISRVDDICNISLNALSTYTYDKFFTRNNQIGAIYHKILDNNVLIYMPYIDLATTTISKNNISTTIPLKFSIKTGTDIAIDNDANNNINIAYITNEKSRQNISSIKNFIDSDIDFSNVSSHIRYSFNDENIVTLTAYYGNLNRGENIEVEENESTEKYALLYNTYTDNGFFGLISSDTENVNNLDNSILTYDTLNNTISSSEIVERGFLKFLLLSDQKINAMDFKFILPVKMFEAFKNKDPNKHLDTSKSLASYFDAHFGADASDYADSISSNTNITDPIIILSLFDVNVPTIQILEKYYNYIDKSDALRLYNESAIYPYLWYDENIDIPDKYFNPGKNCDTTVGDDDNTIIQVFPNTLPISVSWYKDENGILLDFNTAYYRSFAGNNYFNEKRLFLNLKKSGLAGYLNTYINIDKMNMPNSVEIPICDVLYYIKNISDEYPKFILSAILPNTDTYNYKYLLTDTGDKTITDDDKYHIIICDKGK